MSPGHKHTPERCEAREILDRIGDKWSLYVVSMLEPGPLRFSQLKRTIPGISQRMLTLTLRGLERDGLVTRTVYPTVPPSGRCASRSSSAPSRASRSACSP
jgi:DNA-binding HxlR family transcriptional regulator